MNFRAHVCIVVLICVAGWAQKGNGPVGGTEPLPQFGNIGSTLQYHHREWEVIKRTKATFDAASGPSELALLRSLKPTGASGAGQPLSDVELLILQNGKVIYDHSETVTESRAKGNFLGETARDFFIDDYLEIRDLTHDGPRAVLFHSGSVGASDWETVEHVVRWDKSKGSFADVAPGEFFSSRIRGLRWFTLAGGTFVVISDRNWNPTTPIEDQCHVCPSPFVYDAYQWNSKEEAFIANRHFYGKQWYETGASALEGDEALIQSGLNQ